LSKSGSLKAAWATAWVFTARVENPKVIGKRYIPSFVHHHQVVKKSGDAMGGERTVFVH
jgi:hypothetical protein